MSHPVAIKFARPESDVVLAHTGRLALVIESGKPQTAVAKVINKAMRGGLARAMASDAFAKLKSGDALELAFPAGLAADAKCPECGKGATPRGMSQEIETVYVPLLNEGTTVSRPAQAVRNADGTHLLVHVALLDGR